MNFQKYDETFDRKALDKKEVQYESPKSFERMVGLTKNEKVFLIVGLNKCKISIILINCS